MITNRLTIVFASFGLLVSLLLPTPIQASPYRVLVVMSYEEHNPWCKEIREGIDSVLSDSSKISYFYMDTKTNIKDGHEKAKKAYMLFREIEPHGVITADDNAQQMFVLPYLSSHPETPIIFCGVNAEAEQYGFPTSTISGILERGHIRESIAFAKQLLPSLETIAFLAKESPSGRALLKQVKDESQTYLSKTSFHLIKSIHDLNAIEHVLQNKSDAIYIDSMEGVKDSSGKPLSSQDIINILSARYRKPIIGANQYHVEQGALCAVVKTGQEQGSTAANMLLKAMQGTPVNEIAVVRNFKGKRVINVTALKALNLRVKPIHLLGTMLVKSSE